MSADTALRVDIATEHAAHPLAARCSAVGPLFQRGQEHFPPFEKGVQGVFASGRAARWVSQGRWSMSADTAPRVDIATEHAAHPPAARFAAVGPFFKGGKSTFPPLKKGGRGDLPLT
jgi:hypothetical protein